MKTIKTLLLSNVLILSAMFHSQHLQGAEAPPVPVAVSEVKVESLNSSVIIHGTIYGRNDVNLTAAADGQLTYIAEPGDRVEKDKVIARIDMLPLQLMRAEQSALIKRANINLTYYKKELSRLEKLAKTDSAAKYQVDQLQNQHDLAQSDIELAEIKLKQLDDRIARATVRAPFTGIVSKRFKQVGSDVIRAQELVTLIDTENLELRLFVPVKYLNYLKNGQHLQLKSEAFDRNIETSAEITAVIPTTDARSQTFEIRALIQPAIQNQWASGQLIEVEVPLIKENQVSIVDRDAIILRKNNVYIVKIDEHNKAHQIPVNVGIGKGQWVEVKALHSDKPLNRGDKVAIRGAERLSEGQTVTIQ